jgi:proteic killer suppression protein
MDMQIVGFRHKGLERFWRNDDARGVAAKQIEKLRAMLTAIEEAENIGDMAIFWLASSPVEGRSTRHLGHGCDAQPPTYI